jgi:hypothetical protein
MSRYLIVARQVNENNRCPSDPELKYSLCDAARKKGTLMLGKHSPAVFHFGAQ